MPQDKPLVVAHRGASGITGQDNTLESFDLAACLGCDMAELDVRRTIDGQLVCFHDDSAGGKDVETLTRDQLNDLSGADVPGLGEVVELCRGRIALDVEIKVPGCEGQIIDELLNGLVPEQFVVKSFIDSVVARVGQIDGSVRIGLLVGALRASQRRGHAFDSIADRLDKCGADFLSPHHSLVKADLLAHGALGSVGLMPWTVDSPAEMRRLVDLGVWAIVSNRPDLLMGVVGPARPGLAGRRVREIAAWRSDEGLVASLAGRSVDDVPIPTRHVRVAAGAIEEVARWVESLWSRSCRCAVVMDENTRRAAGREVCAQLDRPVEIVLTPMDGWGHVTPHECFVEALGAEAADCDALIAVGSGTINDITKCAAQRIGRPYMAVPTAASMNGYTSSIAAIVTDGLKRTLPCSPPIAVIGDVDVLASAPTAMAASGYADLLSKPVSTADWKLASIIIDEPFSDIPSVVVSAAIDHCITSAEGIAAMDSGALATLTKCLVLSGFSMTLAGSSAPASGGEHLISHYWDMTAYMADRSPAPHGFQVAIGTLLTSRLYELLAGRDPSCFTPYVHQVGQQVRVHGPLWSAIEGEARKQHLSAEAAQRRLEKIKDRWRDIWRDLAGVVRPHAQILADLTRAGVPTRPEELGIAPEAVRKALLHSADIRARYTVLDLARDTSQLALLADEVLASAFG